jgi:site-specific DNA-methyltransferase (adenine-specific)
MPLYRKRLLRLSGEISLQGIENWTINQDLFTILDWLPESFVDLLFIDPPYNLTKSFRESIAFRERSVEEYAAWLESWFSKLSRALKPTASVYICGDWRSSTAIHSVAEKYLCIRNRITWERIQRYFSATE